MRDRLRADRDRAGVRVRLRGLPGPEGAPRGRVRTIVVNSNPATIMTDPGFADRTYIEPLDLESVADVLRRERPDALLPTLGGQTALNLAVALEQAGVLAELGVELIGAPTDVIHRAEDRELFRRRCRAAACTYRSRGSSTSLDELEGVASAGRRAARLHARGPRRRVRGRRGQLRRQVGAGPGREPDRPGARRGVRARLGRVRARGDPGPRRQRRRSSARSRTSTRWACTPATPSPSRPR